MYNLCAVFESVGDKFRGLHVGDGVFRVVCERKYLNQTSP